MLKRILSLFILVFAGLMLFAVTVAILFPAGSIGDFIIDNAKNEYGVKIKYRKLERVFPFGIEATGVEVTGQARGIDLFIDRLSIKYKPARLFTGKIGFAISADLLEGQVDASVRLGVSKVESDLLFSAIRPELLPVARRVALSVPISFSGSIDVIQPYKGCAEGTFIIDSDSGGSGHFSALGFGLDFGNTIEAGGRVELNRCRVVVENMWLEGENIVARLKGDVTLGGRPDRSRLDLLAEVNEKRVVKGNRLLLSFLNSYKVTDGYYGIKIGGTAARPIIRRNR